VLEGFAKISNDDEINTLALHTEISQSFINALDFTVLD